MKVYELTESQLREDCLTLALRLYGEDESTFSPEAYEAMKRWKPECEKLFNPNRD